MPFFTNQIFPFYAKTAEQNPLKVFGTDSKSELKSEVCKEMGKVCS